MKRISLGVMLLCLNTAAQGVEIIDTGIIVQEKGMTRSSIHWWDNDNLLVAGVQAARPPTDRSGWRLLRYKPSEKSVTDMGQVGALCVSNEHIRLSRLSPESVGKPFSDWKYTLFSGSIDKIVEEPPRHPTPPSPNPPSFNELSNCKFPDELPISPWLEAAKKSGRLFTALRPEHGWAEMEYAQLPEGSPDKFKGMHPVRIYPPGNSEQAKSVEGLEQIDLGSIWPYFAFKNAYLLDELPRVTPRTTGFVRTWWLYPDGHVEPALQYDRAIRRGDTRWAWAENVFIPTREGFLLVYERLYSRAPLANVKTGLYRYQPDGNFTKVASGGIEGFAVSPDGCRVAFGADDSYRDGRSQYALKIIDVCKN